jgi:hypothetical protein
MKKRFAVLCCLAAPAAAVAQEGPHAAQAAPTIAATRVTSPIHVDGRLDEPAWATAQVVSSFTQYDPDEGQPASELTEARVMYDDEALYVGFRLHDRGKVNMRLGRRDMDLADADWVGVVVDSYHDHTTAYSFDINPSGVRRDETKTDAGDDNSWDAVWEANATVDSGGWTAEYRIPFSQVRFNPRVATWGIQLERIIGRRNEYSVFAFTPKRERGGIARYGHLTGMEGIRTGKRLELLPYTVARAEYVDPRGNPFRSDPSWGSRFGADVKYRVSSNLTLDATVNPDFGQVELDPAVVNLTQFETVFEEKRPFFVEGREIFNFGGGNLPSGGALFYSRRVGGLTSAVGPPTLAADLPQNTRILGAAKLSGKTAGGWSIGILDALTGREEARFRDALGDDHTMLVEPTTNYFVGRLKRELRGGATSIGGLLTAVNRDLSTPDLQGVLRSSGYTAGIDFIHEFSKREWALSGFGSFSTVRGSQAALLREQIVVPYHNFARPDSRVLSVDSAATALSGFQADVALRKQAGTHWRWFGEAATITPGYEVADFGTQRRASRIDLSSGVNYLERRPGKVLRFYNLGITGRREYNYDGDHILSLLETNGFVRHLNYWTANYAIGGQLRSLDDRLTRGGPLAERPANLYEFLQVNSDARKALVGNAGVFNQRDDAGGRDLAINAGVQLKVSPRWNLSVGPAWEKVHAPAQYVGSIADPTPAALFGRRYLFTALDQTILAMETRFNYTFSPGLTLELFAAPFISAVDFGEQTQYLVAPRTFRFAPDTVSGVQLEDFNVRSLRGNAVLRWEWRPGSTVYLAWQQVRDNFAAGVGDFDFGRDRAALFRAQPDNVFLIKINYWFNPL